MDDNMQNYQSEVTGVVKKSKKPVAIIAAVTAVVLIGGCGVAYAAVPVVQNTVKMAIMSPEKYCADVYDNFIDEFKKDTDEKYKSISGGNDNIENISVSTTVNAELSGTVMSLVEDQLGYEIFNKISLSADIYSDMADSTGKIKLNIKADDNSVITANAITDLKEEMIYYQIPEMSDKYISTDLSGSIGDMDISEEGLRLTTDLSIDDFDDVLPRYAEILTDVIKNSESELEKGCEGTVRGVDYKYNKIITTLDQNDYEDLLNNIADEWEDDDVLKKYYTETLKMSEEDYDAVSDEIRDAADNIKEDDVDNTVETLVDSEGTIRGIIISEEETEDELSFIMAKDGNDVAIEINCADEFIVGIDAEEDNDEYTGKLEVTADTDSLSLTFEDFKVIDDKFISGSIGCDLSEVTDSNLGKINLDFEKVDDTQRISTEINGIGKFSIDIKQEYNKDKEEIKTPENAISSDDMDQYLEDADTEKALSDICDALKIKKEDAETIVQGIMGNFNNGIGGISDSEYSDDIVYSDDFDDSDTYVYDNNDMTVEYSFNALDINLNNEKVVFPVINPSLVPEKSKAAMVEPGEYTNIYEDDQSVSLSLMNNTENQLAVPECSLVGIDIYGDNMNASVNGIKIGSSIEDVKKAFGITDDIASDISSIYVDDSDGTFSSVSIGFEDGIVTNISLYCFDD